MKYKFLKSEEVQEILKAYPNTKAEILAEKHGVPVRKIYATAKRHSIKKSAEFLASSDSGRMKKGQTISPNTQFKKGMVSPRKGKKMLYKSEASEKKAASSRWKKGNIPPNAGKDGEVRWREGLGYMFIRLSENNWVLYHKWLWEYDNGPVPAGFNIVFKDGDSKNCIPENLECISNAELMSRNTIQRYPEELRDIMMLNGRLNKAIKNQENS